MIRVEQVTGECNSLPREDALQVIHSTPGRLRVRLAWLKYYPALNERLSTSMLSLVVVKEVRSNPAINSIVVSYDSGSITEKAFQEKFRQLVQQLTPASWLTAEQPTNDGTNAPGEGIFPEAVATQKIQQVGSKLIGSTIGRIMGLGVGSLTGGVLLGPLGIIPGAGVGSAVGRTVGSQLGEETIRYLSQTPEEASTSPEPAKDPAAFLQATLKRGATGLVGETVGGITGLAVGGSLLGPLGFLFGGIVGGVIGGQVGEEWWCWQQVDREKRLSQVKSQST
jgi:hypothetical protein